MKALTELNYCSRVHDHDPRNDRGYEWNNSHEWFPVEEKGEYKVWLDVGLGNIALTKGSEFIGFGKREVIVPGHPVILDMEYYGVEKYIWE